MEKESQEDEAGHEEEVLPSPKKVVYTYGLGEGIMGPSSSFIEETVLGDAGAE